MAHAGQGNRERLVANRAERRGNVFCLMPVDFAQEAQRDMELFVILPARAGNAAHHPQQLFSYGCRRADCDEQAVHGRLFEDWQPQIKAVQPLWIRSFACISGR
jgi:hypothetical protein